MSGIKTVWRTLQRAFLGVGEAPSQHVSFLLYQRARWLKIALVLCALAALVYLWHDPIEGKSGSTWLGYGLGTLGAVLIGWLAYLGVRKRQFQRGAGRVQGWVSAHVYLGLALTVVVTLHTGFQLGWNVHTLAYGLMLLVILSGLYGISAYAVIPRQITANRDALELRAMLEQITSLNQTALALAERIDPETHAITARSVSEVRIGGSAWEQLSGRYRRVGEVSGLEQFARRKRAELLNKAVSAAQAPARGGRQATIAFVADQIFAAGGARGHDKTGDDKATETLQKLLQTIARRKNLVARVNRDITLRARLNVWLYVHIPLTVALLAALLIHILVVFLYW